MEDSGILLVDDDPLFLMLLSKCFMQQGMAVHCANNGGDALHMIKNRSFTLLVTDLQMCGMSGLELAEMALAIVPHLKIVLCTGAVTPEVTKQAEITGIVQVVRKPVRFGELLSIVRELVGQHRPAIDAAVGPSSPIAKSRLI